MSKYTFCTVLAIRVTLKYSKKSTNIQNAKQTQQTVYVGCTLCLEEHILVLLLRRHPFFKSVNNMSSVRQNQQCHQLDRTTS